MHSLRFSLASLAGSIDLASREFHVRREARDRYGWNDSLFAARGDVFLADAHAARTFADAVNQKRGALDDAALRASDVNAMGLIHEILHAVIALYRQRQPRAFKELTSLLRSDLGDRYPETQRAFVETFPNTAVYKKQVTIDEYLRATEDGIANEDTVLEETLLLWIANANAAYAPIQELIDDRDLRARTAYEHVFQASRKYFDDAPRIGKNNESLLEMLMAPMRHAPHSLMGQLEFMREEWGLVLEGSAIWRRLLFGVDFIREEGKWFEQRKHGFHKSDNVDAANFRGELYEHEPEQFSADHDWMPRVVMIAKSTFVWLSQLSRWYGRPIETLADIPDEELDTLARRGFTGLWLIGLWKRSRASQRIKQIQGNHDAVASAYSLFDYEIADDIGGYLAYCNLRDRAQARGIRLASDMVPNHMGIDSSWVVNHPERFIQSDHPPFAYNFNGTDLSDDPRVGIFIEDGYYSRTDAAVVFKRLDRHTGDAKYIYHGNDGTSMPWNDTAQLDYLRADVRESVIQTILHVARMFPIIRFDAAMTLAKRHFQRLWFPIPGSGGDIPSRAEHALTKEQFDQLMPVEFWREVVDRVAREVPETLLLAEAFWMMEGFFVRTLGMHRVYNSAFMNMLKREENEKFRASIRNVLEYNPQILKRHVNFMNNPDEETALAQFGKDDKYFGVCILMATMPGLPMFGHGQIEGFHEKYGMEYKRPRHDENPDGWLVDRHEREVFPLLKRRYIWSDVASFYLYDFVRDGGGIDEDVFAYSNAAHGQRGLVLYHNKFKDTRGWARESVGFLEGDGSIGRRSIGEGLGLSRDHDVFAIFRNAVTGLEHLRSVSEIWERGFYTELGAFKYEVFVEWREARDSTATPYRELAGEIGRGGVPSIDIAIVELVFRAVHSSLYEAIAKGSVEYLASTTAAKRRSAIEEKLTHLFDGARFVIEKQTGARVESRVVDEEITARAEKRIASIARVTEARKTDEAFDAAVRAFAGVPALNLLVAIAFAESSSEIRQAIVRDHANAFDAWRLDRAIERALREAGAGDAARFGVALARFVVLHPEVTSVEAALELEDGRQLLGVHAHDGIEYFHKEAFEAFAYLTEARNVIEEDAKSEAPKRARKSSAPPPAVATTSAKASPSAPPPKKRSTRPPARAIDAEALAKKASDAGYKLADFRASLKPIVRGKTSSRPSKAP